MPPVKLLFIISGLGVGGTERNLVYLLRRMDRERFAVRVWCLEGGGSQETAVAELGIPVEILDIPKVNGCRTLRRLPELLRRLRSAAPECICCMSFDAELVGVPLAFLAGCGNVCTVRRDMGDWGRTRRQYRVRRALNPFVRTVVANCMAVGEAVHTRERLAPRKLTVIPNGIPLDDGPDPAAVAAYRTRFGADGVPVITAVGNYRNAVKGHAYLLRAAERLHAAGRRFTCVIAGAGRPGSPLEHELRGLAAALPEGTVRFTGRIRDVPALLGASDVCVNPSLSEGMSNAVLEYMAAARPVVATAAGGTSEVVEEGVTGLLVPPGDAVALAGALETLLDDADARGRMGRAGRKRVEAHFSDERMARAYERLFAGRAGAAG